jgi:hypothetical protein
MRELRGESDHASVQKEVSLLVRVFSRFIISVVLSDMLDWSKLYDPEQLHNLWRSNEFWSRHVGGPE